MKILFAEAAPIYETYTFPYGIYGLPVSAKEYETAYEKGFLPYTGNSNLEPMVFYKARSLRIDLNQFEESSETRRLSRKFNNFGLSVREGQKELKKDRHFRDFVLSYAVERFNKGELNEQRLDYILTRPYLSGIKVFERGGDEVAYLLYCAHGNHFHYWFAFYSLQFPSELPLGKYIMWKSIHLAKESGFNYIYLGTCYGGRSLYKARDFKGVEFHDGNQWVGDLKELKTICKMDDNNALASSDRFKFNCG